MNPEGRVRVSWWLVGGLLVSAAVATKLAVDKRALKSAYTQARAQIAQLQEERTSLSQELTTAEQTLDTQTGELAALEQELSRIQSRLALADRELAQLQQENRTLNDQLASATADKRALEARLSSLTELKGAIREVKARLRRQRWEAWVAYVSARRAEEQRRLAKGNRGYVIRNGVPTLGSPTKLQVRVLEPQEASP